LRRFGRFSERWRWTWLQSWERRESTPTQVSKYSGPSASH